jgi:hypothetical protein
VQGRHPRQTSNAIGGAASQLGPRGLALANQLNKGLRQGYEILSKPSASSLHQIQHIYERVPVVSSQRWSKTVRGQPSQRKSMSPLSATISPVNKQHYEGLLRAANAVGTYSDRDIAFQEA